MPQLHNETPAMFLTSSGHYNDRYNDVFADRHGGYWFVRYRGPGNVSVLVSKHRNEDRAVAAASRVAREREAAAAARHARIAA